MEQKLKRLDQHSEDLNTGQDSEAAQLHGEQRDAQSELQRQIEHLNIGQDSEAAQLHGEQRDAQSELQRQIEDLTKVKQG